MAMDRRQFLGSAALVGVAAARADEPPPALTALFFGGTLPEVRKELGRRYRLTLLSAGPIPKDDREMNGGDVSGLEKLKDADVWVGSASKRTMPSEEQLGHFKAYLAAGKPFVGYRAASHVFQNWLEGDQQVFGATYGGHHLLNKEKNPGLEIEVADGAADHPILKGLEPPKPSSGSYKYTKLADDVTVLLRSGLPGDMMPHTWVRRIAKTKNRVFYTRYDAKELATLPACREIFLRGIAWVVTAG